MSDKKNELYKYLVENSFDAPPTVRELCEALDIKSTSSIHRMLHELEDEGRITIAKGKRRNIALSGAASTVKVPLVGTVAAGLPILAEENIEDYVSFTTSRTDTRELFALRVKGESMIGAGIFDGDIIIAKRAQTADEGEIVVALLGDEATVKRLYHRNGRVELHAENPAFAPIVADEILVLGKVIASMRYYD
ncbi:MAG: transcriptional repressor LexA [Oscillospiraceae bacterium]|nr:transcriptional repressor LexA [Oscillospiraceae bacterium]